MGLIIDYIDQQGHGRYHCYRTRKQTLDTPARETLDYDDKPATQVVGNVLAETDKTRSATRAIPQQMICADTTPIFSFFLDGSRHTYKIDDIAIGKRIFPFVAGQIVVGCCQRQDRDTFRPVRSTHSLVLALPTEFDVDDGGDNFRRFWTDKLNTAITTLPYVHSSGLRVSDILLYATDRLTSGRSDELLSRAIAAIQTAMTDEEQRLVGELCEANKLDDEHWLIKDGSLEYIQPHTIDPALWASRRLNYAHVVGVSKSFNPDLLLDYDRRPLSRTIAALKPWERTKVYRYASDRCNAEFAVWYVRLRHSDYRATHFSDVVKCEILLPHEGANVPSTTIDLLSAGIIGEAYPVCYGQDSRWANHLYPVFLTETYCKAQYTNSDIILNLF